MILPGIPGYLQERRRIDQSKSPLEAGFLFWRGRQRLFCGLGDQ
jgi:hypothetical protein